MRMSVILTATLALAVAACGGSDGGEVADSAPPPDASPVVTDAPAATSASTPATEPIATSANEEPETVPPPEPLELFSSDGELGIGYLSGGPDVRIRLLDSSEWPTELAGADPASVKIFELEPDGATFDEPVTVTRRVDISAFDALDLGPFDVPLVTMLTQNDDGDYELLDDLSLVRIGPDLFVTGTTTHFSPIILSNENRMIPWGPGEGEFPPAPPITETYLDPEEFLHIMRGLLDVPPAQLVVEEDRWLTAQELLDHVHVVIERQNNGDEAAPGNESAPFGLFDDDGFFIEGERLDSLPIQPDDGAYRAERFGTSFPTIPASLLPSTTALTGDPNATITLAVWIPGLVLTAEALVDPTPSDVEVPVTDAAVDQNVADCFMYLELYPELLEIDPGLVALCESDVAAARTIISGLLDEVGG